jgi:NAD(P)H-hydrate epimerase
MQKVLTAEEMREVDRLTTEKYGIPSLIMMENAAHAAARVITEKLGGSVEGKSVLVLCGKGNNGGDGAALARILWTMGASVEVYLFGKVEDTKGDARVNFEILDKIDPEVSFWEIDEPMNLFSKNLYRDSKVVIDAIFGTGLSRQIKGELGDFVKAFAVCQEQKDNVLLISLDIPSGLNSNLSDTIYDHFQADLTVTFTAPKPSNVLAPAYRYNGDLVVANIGSPPELIDSSPSQLYVAEKSDAQKWLRKTEFTSDSYKKKRGHALLVAGSRQYAGAAVLCANACVQTGVGLVTLATPNSAYYAVAPRLAPEIMCSDFIETPANESIKQISPLTAKADVVAIGCGLRLIESKEDSVPLVNWGNKKDSAPDTESFIRNLVKISKPLVIDAEAINVLSPFNIKGSETAPIVLTPHEGEFLRLLGETDQGILADRVSAVRDFSEKHNVILVLKGERTLIGSPDGRVVVNPTGNSGLGKGGNGDTLTGIIAGFIAQTISEKNYINPTFIAPTKIDLIFEAVVAAVYIGGLAGDIAERRFGKRIMNASDVRDCLKETMEKINQ